VRRRDGIAQRAGAAVGIVQDREHAQNGTVLQQIEAWHIGPLPDRTRPARLLPAAAASAVAGSRSQPLEHRCQHGSFLLGRAGLRYQETGSAPGAQTGRLALMHGGNVPPRFSRSCGNPETGCLVPGYPELALWQDDYWERFWRV